ncbi:basigin-like [Ptychodera flava]|uniref:basigin-like n=1 Tax=Ptychodera flava TaxID=63121 RepID=UPI003969FE37
MDVEIKTNNTLVILNSELTDTGVYECIVSHQVGGKTVEERHPKEVTAPLTIKLPQSVNLEEGENARILCEVSSFPPPMVTWYRGSEMLSNGSNDGRTWVIETPPGSPQVMSTLMIKKVVDADRDVYTCNATNSANEKDSKECLLRVKDRLAALWPFIGIMCEVIVLVAIILLCERRQKSKMMNDDVDDIPEAKKLNDNSNTNESDIRLRNINA